MRSRAYWFGIIFSLLTCIVWGQKSDKVRDLEKQRKDMLAEIEQTNQLLNETKTSARNSLNRLNLLTKQINSRKQVIELLNQEINEIEKQITNQRRTIEQLEKELKQKQQNYSNSAQGLYKRRRSQDKLLFILSAENFSQYLRRMRYLREYANWQKQQATAIIDKQKEISLEQKKLEATRAEKQTILGTREEENRKLISEETTKKEEVRQLGQKQKQLQATLRKKQQQANALNQQIERQIAAEIAAAQGDKNGKAKEERKAETKGGYAMTKEEKQLSDNFGSNRGRLPYPVTGTHTIVTAFGEQQHQELKYVRTNNNGIDIQTTPGAEARSVFNGIVTRVFVVPGYNNSVIIRHGNYLTVYSNLSQVYVKAGDKVSTRQSIGKIFVDSEDGNATILHFQIWKEKTKLNPTPWLN